jgi:hypothetical protein
LLLLAMLLLQALSSLQLLQKLHLCNAYFADHNDHRLQLSGLTALTELKARKSLILNEGDVLPPNLKSLWVRFLDSVQPLLPLTQLQVGEQLFSSPLVIQGVYTQ